MSNDNEEFPVIAEAIVENVDQLRTVLEKFDAISKIYPRKRPIGLRHKFSLINSSGHLFIRIKPV